ncbi:MAG TPA: molecular chaperone DnaJ [Cyanobacteria bacterium UBA8803]|nr:molecular chaperone DnaJ [Cyanobacteria bacterium UBA9273]HBL62731.1 molecular chaperone DnaJ [Cyanobacteria bacterium UBA8803]
MPRPSSSRPTRTPSLALSSLHLHLSALEKEHQWLLKQIKRKRTEVKNFVEQMRSLATEVFQRGTSSFNKVSELDREIHALFDEIFTARKMGKATKKKIQKVYQNLQMAGIISIKLDNEREDVELDELFETSEQEDNFSQEPKESYHQQQEARQELDSAAVGKTGASRKIRQTFLRLAEIFHPDKVRDTETLQHHTEIMKEINKAYQEGDLARLLEIERQHQEGESISSNNEDDLTRQCNRLEQENELLKTQYETLKRELRMAKNTPEGELVSDCRKAKKAGIDPIGQMLEQVDSQLALISEIRDFVRDFRDQKMSFQEFLDGPEVLRSLQREFIEDILEQMFYDLL